MEGGGPRRQYEQANYQPSRGYGASIPGTGVPERYGQSQTQAQQPSARASAGNHGSGLYPYTQGQQQYAPQMQDTSLQYQSDFPQDTQRQSQFPAYSSSMMYSMSAPVHQAQQSPSFESVQQYQPRQSAAIEVLPNQFGVPQYYNTGEPTTASAQIPHTYSTAQYQQQPPFQQSLSGHRATESTSYATGVGDYSHLSMSNVIDQSDSAQEASAMEETFKYYTSLLKETYQCTHEGKLVEAGHKLLDLSKWLLGNVAALGLTKDEQNLQNQRLELWNGFNHCWLAVLQKQKDMTLEMMNNLNQHPPQTLLQEEFLKRMGDDLVRLCDDLEGHGLVDYEMGVWEEEITNVLIECIKLIEGDPEEPAGPSIRANLPSASRSS